MPKQKLKLSVWVSEQMSKDDTPHGVAPGDGGEADRGRVTAADPGHLYLAP